MSKQIKMGDSMMEWRGEELEKLTRNEIYGELEKAIRAIAADAAANAPDDPKARADGAKDLKQSITWRMGKNTRFSSPRAWLVSDSPVKTGTEEFRQLAYMIEFGTTKRPRTPFMWPAVDRGARGWVEQLKNLINRKAIGENKHDGS